GAAPPPRGPRSNKPPRGGARGGRDPPLCVRGGVSRGSPGAAVRGALPPLPVHVPARHPAVPPLRRPARPARPASLPARSGNPRDPGRRGGGLAPLFRARGALAALRGSGRPALRAPDLLGAIAARSAALGAARGAGAAPALPAHARGRGVFPLTIRTARADATRSAAAGRGRG